MHPDLFGGLWVVITLFIWQWPRWITTFSPRTWYWAKHGSQPFSSELHGWDKLLAWCESLPVYLVYLCHPTKCGPVTYIYTYIHACVYDMSITSFFLYRKDYFLSDIFFHSSSLFSHGYLSLSLLFPFQGFYKLTELFTKSNYWFKSRVFNMVLLQTSWLIS